MSHVKVTDRCLRFKPVIKDLVWGNESWLLGGKSFLSNADITLDNLLGECPDYLFGDSKPLSKFPLLIKLISTKEWLSIQVHPDDKTARKLEKDPWGKSEMWYFLHTEDDSQIIHGFNHSISPIKLKKSIQDNTIQHNLRFDIPKKGDWIYIPAGCIHALGKNVQLLEIQQNSEITYRLYDWNRLMEDGNPRELHLNKALQSIHYFDNKTFLRSDPINQKIGSYLVKTIPLNGNIQLDTLGLSFHILFSIEKSVMIDHNFKLNPLECCIIPGSVGSYEIEGENQQVVLIERKGT